LSVVGLVEAGTSPPAVSAEYIQSILQAHQRRDDGSDDNNWSDSDGDGWEADELEAMQRMPFGRTHTQAFPRGRYQPRVMARGRGRTGQHLPRDPHLRELMTREIDPNDYETLLQLDEQKKSKHADRQVELLIRNLPRYAWPDKTVPLAGKGKRRVSDEKPGNGKRRRREESQAREDDNEDDYEERAPQGSNGKRQRRPRSRRRPRSPSQDEESAVIPVDEGAGSLGKAAASSSSSAPQAEGSKEPELEACPICLEQFSDGQVVCVTPCASLHTFHETCIKHWLRVKAECPIDKTQLV
jgi:hypothetical protein